MAIPPDLVRALNDALWHLPMTESRIAELPVELGQFRAAMERVQPRLAFDQDPSDFLKVHRAADEDSAP